MADFSIIEYGAIADGETDDAGALQRAIDAAHADGGGRVVLPAGSRVRAGFFELRTRVEFHVAEGAILLSATTEEAFPRRVFGSGDEADKRLWIGAKDAEEIILSGCGTIDGQCRAFALGEEEHVFRPTHPWRPALTCFENVRNVTVRDLTFRDAANWTLHFTGCQDVYVHDIQIFNNLKFPNADGIDPDHCQRVRIERCHIVAADDCIVLKNTAQFTQYGPCEDIHICDCRLESVSAAFKIGSESHGDFRRIQMYDCTIERSNRGLAIQLRDSGGVEDVEFRNIRIETKRFSPGFWGAAEAISITSLPRNEEVHLQPIRDLIFHDIHCEGENGLVIYADPPGGIKNVLFERVHLGVQRHTRWPSGLFDVRPCPPGYLPLEAEAAGESTPWGQPALRPPAIVSIEGAEGVQFVDCTSRAPSGDDGEWIPLRADRPPDGEPELA